MSQRLLLFFIIITSWGGCQPKSEYPKTIKEQGLEKLYDDAKWYLYCVYGDRICGGATFINDTIRKENILLGSSQLSFDTLFTKVDTTELAFRFIVKDSLICYRTREKGDHLWSEIYSVVGFINDSLTYINNGPSSIYGFTGGKFANPTQDSSVVAFINQNQDILHPWFFQEAKKRKVIP